MPLIELDGAAAVQDFLARHAAGGCVVTYSAHWCGPCKQSKPALEQLAADSSCLAIVYEDTLGEDIATYKVRAFPTYVLYKQRAEVRRVEGFNLGAVQALLQECSAAPFSTGQGEALGGAGGGGMPALSPADARAARLAKLGGAGSSVAASSPLASSPAPPAKAAEAKETAAAEPMHVDESDDSKKADEDAAMEVEASEPVDDPVAKLDSEALDTLTSAMGFSLIRAQKGLLYGTGGTVEGAVEWLMLHQDDDDIDAPIERAAHGAAAAAAQSYKCNECGKVLSNMANLELHANKTGHSDFEESTERVVPLTADEKAAKIAEIKDLLKAKRTERETAEKEEEKEREKQRRLMGQEMTKTREQYEIEQRKRDAMLRKKEKDDAKRERERIRAELAKDKAERAANKGKLQSKLGVEGYHPDAIQYDVVEHGEGDHGGDKHTDGQKKKPHASAAKIDEYIAKVSGYKAGGDGGKCLKVLKAYVGNVADNPGEDKYRTIKTDNNVFKTKVKPFVGAKSLLLAVGFNSNDAGDALVLQDDADLALLKVTKAKLEAALVKYG